MTTGLVAGRELDALVAKKVMGLRVWDHYGDNSSLWIGRGEIQERPLPAYSTDVAAAWQVVEHFRKRGWQVLVDWDGPRFGAWVCELWEGEGKPEGIGANAPTAPLAICRAVLAAVAGAQT